MGGVIICDHTEDVNLKNHMLEILGWVMISAAFKWMSQRTSRWYVWRDKQTWQIVNKIKGKDIVVTIVFPPCPQLSFWKKWEENSFLNKAGSERVELDNPSDDYVAVNSPGKVRLPWTGKGCWMNWLSMKLTCPLWFTMCVCPSHSPYVGISVVYKAAKETLERQSSLYWENQS